MPSFQAACRNPINAVNLFISGVTMVRRTFLPLALLLVLGACARSALPEPPPADRDVSAKPVSGPRFFYPTDLLVGRKEGRVAVECVVSADGLPRDCRVVETVGGDAFAAAALDYISQSRFAPAIRGGVPVEAKLQTSVTFGFEHMVDHTRLRDILVPLTVAGYPLVYPKRMLDSGREGTADVTCRITVVGFAKDCAVLNSAGGSAFVDAALDHITRGRYAPELNQGVAVEVQHEFVINFRFNDSKLPIGIPDLPRPPNQNSVVTPISAQPIAGPALAFPAKMLASGKEGVVGVRCFVTVQGTTRNCLLTDSTGDRDFEAAAVELLSQARFTPAAVDGVPIEVPHKWTLRYGDR
jgi:TonB family protein